jgi:transcriptional regulator
LDHETRTAILLLQAQGHGIRFIARTLGVSRESVQKVCRSQQIEVPRMERKVRLDPWVERIQALHDACGGNLIRVHEELGREGVEVPYSTLTRFC